jgi:CheY-like chemotaxis protein
MQRVFVKVIGFSDVERHALNTLFRLSEERETGYALWNAELGVGAQMALIDSESHEAMVEFEAPSNEGMRMVWVGSQPPERAWRSFQRPIDWPAVISAMDQLFMPPPDIEVSLDFDLDVPEAPAAPPEGAGAVKRALIANADRAERLYIRARMSLADLTQADEAETAADALELARNHRYDVAVVDYALPGKGGYELVRQLGQAEQRIPHLIVTKEKLSAAEKARALLGRQPIVLEKPVHPLKLTALLRRV